MSDDGFGCLATAVAVLLFAVIISFAACSDAKQAARQQGMTRGRQMQFCVDHAGQWDDANVRCLAKSDTITVQVPK